MTKTRKYECVLVIHPGATTNDNERILNRFEETVKNHGGEIQNRDDWGMKTLAYPIEKQTSATYYLYSFTADNKLVEAADRDLRLDEKVLRHLIVRDEEWAERNRVAQAKRERDEVVAVEEE